MKYLIPFMSLLLLFGCETGRVINNAKPSLQPEKINNIAVAAETATRTWIPWYILLIIVLVIITVKTWKEKTN
tara:strand:- start:5320 stop:5538 length:219 start_codon:yes stop_codon:yes gene_type:complete